MAWNGNYFRRAARYGGMGRSVIAKQANGDYAGADDEDNDDGDKIDDDDGDTIDDEDDYDGDP